MSEPRRLSVRRGQDLPPEEGEDGIEQGKRLIRVADDKGLSLTQKIAHHFYLLSWKTPIHGRRLKGKYPLKLLAVPDDDVPGDGRAGAAVTRHVVIGDGQQLERIFALQPAAMDRRLPAEQIEMMGDLLRQRKALVIRDADEALALLDAVLALLGRQVLAAADRQAARLAHPPRS